MERKKNGKWANGEWNAVGDTFLDNKIKKEHIVDQHTLSAATPTPAAATDAPALQTHHLCIPSPMLSNPPPMSGPQSRQSQHRRQNSTPSAFEGVKIAPLPSLEHQRPHVSHRRGLSLDTRRQQLAPTPPTTTTRQDYTTVSISTTNHGFTSTPHHGLRDAQQLHTLRPGSRHSTHSDASVHHPDESDNFLLSPQITPQSRRFGDSISGPSQVADVNGLSFEPYLGPLDMLRNPPSFDNNNGIDPSRDFDFFGSDSALSTPTFLTFPESSPASASHGWISDSDTASTQSRRSSRRISNAIMDKVAKFEALGTGLDASSQRPSTPTNQNPNGAHLPAD